MKIPPLQIKKGLVLSVEAIVGKEGYSIAARDRLSYCRDANFRSAIQAHYSHFENFPSIIIWPKNTVQLAQLVRLAIRYKTPIVPYGGGSGVCGGALPIPEGMLIDFKKMQRLLRVDESRLFAEAEPGIYGLQLEKELNRRGFTLGHFPSSILVATLGGYLAARSAGQQSNKYGKIEDMVIDLEFIDGNGDTVRTTDVSRRSEGFDLTQAIIGSEGTLGLITKARFRIFPLPEQRYFSAFRFSRFEHGMEAIRRVLQAGIAPDVLRLYDETDTAFAFPSDKNSSENNLMKSLAASAPDILKNTVHQLKKSAMGLALKSRRIINALAPFSPVGSMLVCVFEGSRSLARAERDIVTKVCRDMGAMDAGKDPAIRWFEHRYAVSYKAAKLFQEGAFTDTMEIAAPWSVLPEIYQAVRNAITPHAIVLAHLSHAYPDGAAVYFTFVAPLDGLSRSLKSYDRIWHDALHAVQTHGGIISHHHGIGRLKSRFIKKEWGDASEIYEKLKKTFDPHHLLNPGVLFPAEDFAKVEKAS